MNKIQSDQKGFSAIEAVIILIVLGVLAVAGWYVWHSRQTKPVKSTSTQSRQTSSQTKSGSNATLLQSGVTPGPGATWNTYTNKQLGFSIQIPKQYYDPNGSYCRKSTNPSSYYDQGGVVPAGIFQDGDNFYVDAMYTFQLTGEKASDSQTTFSGCKKVQTTTALIEQSEKTNSSTATYFPLPFSVQPASSETDIKNWVQKKFNGRAMFVSLTANKSGWQDVNLKCLSAYPLCMNYSFQLRYYADKHRLVYLELGQAAHLMTPDQSGAYDQQIFDSFKLL